MVWKNDQETLTKCDQCGKFVNEGDAFFGAEDPTDEESLALAFCNESCADTYHGLNFNGYVDDDGVFVATPF